MALTESQLKSPAMQIEMAGFRAPDRDGKRATVKLRRPAGAEDPCIYYTIAAISDDCAMLEPTGVFYEGETLSVKLSELKELWMTTNSGSRKRG